MAHAPSSGRSFAPALQEPFVQVAEVWYPDGEGGLRHGAGAYGPHADFARRSVQMRFVPGQGLVGTAWQQARAVLWPELGETFARITEAKAIGLTAGLALPYFRGPSLAAVLVLLCGAPRSTAGAMELWAPAGGDGLELESAYYGGLDNVFRGPSSRYRFAYGEGLPGRAQWLKAPVLVSDLREPSAFNRADLAEANGLGVGLSLPIIRGGQLEHVLTLLSCVECPLARAFEVWAPDTRGHLRLTQSAYGAGLEEFAQQSRRCVFGPSEGLPGRAYSTGLPTVFGTVSVGPFVRHEAAERAGLQIGVALPVDGGAGTRSVVVLLR